MPKISHVKLDYIIYQSDSKKEGRYFGLVYRGPNRVFSFTIENATSEANALQTLKDEYAKLTHPVPDYVPRHD